MYPVFGVFLTIQSFVVVVVFLKMKGRAFDFEF